MGFQDVAAYIFMQLWHCRNLDRYFVVVAVIPGECLNYGRGSSNLQNIISASESHCRAAELNGTGKALLCVSPFSLPRYS